VLTIRDLKRTVSGTDYASLLASKNGARFTGIPKVDWSLTIYARVYVSDGDSTKALSGGESQTLFDGPVLAVFNVGLVRQIEEQARASISKEDYSAHAALVYKLGAGN